ncbi:MAG: DUF3800 domain-containing protein [Methylovulum sp.]|uniref:DUF3800 domain-containing protein n=1 Tax=Methylovulum sp. TaxID=1916980 RepID=UPI002602F166|nr:DUF3800 domain-containing protein [Methylovulum sp.]MDD2725523.1 DUF3800 domain-containing protein [Methylovulum sp.]MDD5126147.1 DUF3800 domain-containing protein [Methylovulum sp.]
MRTTIAFDESGNTGGNGLLDQNQPVFVLASCRFSENEAKNLLTEYIYTHQTIEAKFTKLKKSNAGQKSLIKFLNEIAKSPNEIKIMIYHKQFMVVTKIVDMLIEELAYKKGIDLYQNGTNVSMSNMFYYLTPILCGKENTFNMYQAFVEMIKKQDDASIANFYYSAWQVYSASIDERYQSKLKPILTTEPLIKDILKNTDLNSLDPAIPAFFALCAFWGKELNDNFDVLHDNSKPIFQEKETLEACMSEVIPKALIGYDIRKFEFPLKANGVVFGDSKKDYRLQVADLLAGSFAYWAKGRANNCIRDDLWQKLNDLNLEQFPIFPVWPHDPNDISSLEKYTDDGSGVNAVDYMCQHVNP